MANPSLQIGNSNWAIKEDNLLGYSTAGTRFIPQPITMTRGSAGTRVNPQGLVETVELLGSEEVTCGDFACANPDAVWNRGTGWTISGGTAVATSVSSGQRLQQNFSFTNGKSYKIVLVLSSYTSGRLGLYMGGAYIAQEIIEEKTYTYYHTPTSGSEFFFRVMDSGTTLSIDNVTVKEVTKNNLARVDYDGTASSLLVEPERTNLITYSSDASQWINDYSVTITTDSETSPNGLVDADKIEFTQDGSLRPNNSQLTFVNDYNYSIFVKKGNSRYITLQANFFTTNSTIGFDLDTATAQSGGIIENYGNDWFRLSITKNVTGDADRTGAFYIYSPNTLGSASSVAGNYLYVWGAQVEEGSYSTSYIPTSGSSVTRVKDQYSKTGISNLINSEEGVLFLEASTFENGADCRITLSDGTITNRVSIEWDILANTIKGFVGSNGNLVSPATYNQTDSNKIALKYKENDCALWINGTEVDTDITVSALSGVNQLEFSNYGGTVPFEGKVKQLQVFKTALTDPELATLTTI